MMTDCAANVIVTLLYLVGIDQITNRQTMEEKYCIALTELTAEDLTVKKCYWSHYATNCFLSLWSVHCKL